MTKPFSPREFLRARQALLVHFSTAMSGHPEFLYPADMQQALTLSGIPLAFSTIQCGDTNPWGNGRGGAEGSIGIIGDIGPTTVIHSVSPSDSGSNEMGSLGLPPTEENCAASIDQRTTSNEWHVQDYVPAGIFILPPILVRKKHTLPGQDAPILADAPLALDEAMAPFPCERIFSANERAFLEFDRGSWNWKAINYDDIFAC